MMPRFAVILTGVLATWATTASASPMTRGTAQATAGRVDAIAARMAAGGTSYDQATREVIQAANEGSAPDTSRVTTYARVLANGASAYDQGSVAARKASPEPAAVANKRWEKHLAAMTDGGYHDAGWAASASASRCVRRCRSVRQGRARCGALPNAFLAGRGPHPFRVGARPPALLDPW